MELSDAYELVKRMSDSSALAVRMADQSGMESQALRESALIHGAMHNEIRIALRVKIAPARIVPVLV